MDLAEVVTKEVDAAGVRWPGIHVDAAIDERHASASADPVFLDRVLSNLLDNAARASAEAGRAEVEVRVGGRGSDGVTVRVVDHGHGVDPVAREQLFYPFYRLEGRTSKLGTRAGPRHLQGVRRSDGWRTLDRGHARRRGHVRVLAARGRSVTRILVIDDEAHIRRAVERALAARGYEVDAAEDGADALDRAALAPPDLVILDLNMPGVDGLEVTRRLRSWSAVPILILSVREEEPDKIAALDLGADDYLTKPFGVGELLARVRALLRRADAAGDTHPPRYRLGDVEIDLGERRVRRDGGDVHLTKTEWALLETLSASAGKLLTHRWLLERVWGDGYGDDVEVLRVFVSQLRHKIEPDPRRPQAIVTEPGIGYRWTARAEAGG